MAATPRHGIMRLKLFRQKNSDQSHATRLALTGGSE
jgi:hypothetical protein